MTLVSDTSAIRLGPGWYRRSSWLLLIGLVVLVLPLAAAEQTEQTTARSMVASAHPLATRAGVSMLEAGGNAVDAAVAIAFAIGVVEPHASGIGGEGVMILHLGESGRTVVIDAKSTAPGSCSLERSVTGYGAVAVPGSVAGLSLALERFGSISLAQVMAPAISLAEEGFEVSPGLAAAVTEHFTDILEDEQLSALLCPDGLPVEPGMQLRNPELAATLRQIAEHGAEVLYRGALAEQITAAAAAAGAALSSSDLAAYRPVEREPLSIRYRGYTVLATPGPTGGLPVLQNLEMLERYRLTRRPPLAAETVHLVAEVNKRSFADYRAYVADPAFVDTPVQGLLARRYLRDRVRDIDPSTLSRGVEPGEPEPLESASTTSLVAVDASGTMVALTQTLSHQFGARVMVPGTGIILNNEMNNFSRSGVNVCEPGKRPRTSIAPLLILRRGRPVAALATPGSSRIVTTTTLLAVYLIDYGMSLEEAVDTPRYYVRSPEDRLSVEGRFPEATMTSLEGIGYSLDILRDYDPFFGGAQAVQRDRRSGTLVGLADPRRDGAAGGT